MIKDNTIRIKVNPNSREYYKSLGYNCDNYDTIDVKIVDLPKGSNFEIDIYCDNCKIDLIVMYNKYYKATNCLSEDYYCKKCNHIKAKKTKFLKYGDENYFNLEKSKETKFLKYGDENYTNREKTKKTNLEKYGHENVSSAKSVKEKRSNTFMERYGHENPFQSEIIKDQIKKTNLERWGSEYYITSDDSKEKYAKFCEDLGVSHYSMSKSYKDKFEKTCLERWGYKTNLLNKEVIDQIKETNTIRYGFHHAMMNKDISLLNTKKLIESRYDFFYNLGYKYLDYNYEESLYKLQKIDCGHIFIINHDLFRSRVKYKNNSCLVCYPKNELSSLKEKEIVNWIRDLGVKVIENDRNLIKKEIDIYLPDYKIGIEYNGLYYHSDKFKEKKYHIDKTNKCKDIGVSLIHIWEDDWVYKTDIIKSIITNRIKMVDKKIYARKCKVLLVDSKKSKIFLDENHIQGNSPSSIKIGLFYEDELVSLMTFGNRRINSKNKFELIRFCNKRSYTINGSASKLFKYFLNNYDINEILSYSDISMFDGGLYETLGFINDGETSLNYYWTDLNIRYHRFNFNKKKLVKMGYDDNMTEEEIMKNIGYYKIWSCGQIRWIYKR